MLTLSLYPSEVGLMYTFIRASISGQDRLPLCQQTVTDLLLKEYLRSWTYKRMVSWHNRKPTRAYRCSLPLPVAAALYGQLQNFELTQPQQLLLGKLNQAMVNYRETGSEAHVIGELIRQAGY